MDKSENDTLDVYNSSIFLPRNHSVSIIDFKDPVASEGKLLRLILESHKTTNIEKKKHVAALGMERVVKTTALKTYKLRYYFPDEMEPLEERLGKRRIILRSFKVAFLRTMQTKGYLCHPYGNNPNIFRNNPSNIMLWSIMLAAFRYVI